MTPIEASLKIDENGSYTTLQDNREISKPELNLDYFVRTVDKKTCPVSVIKLRGLTNFSQKINIVMNFFLAA